MIRFFPIVLAVFLAAPASAGEMVALLSRQTSAACSVFTAASSLFPPVNDGCLAAPACSPAGMAAGLCFQDRTAFNGGDTTIFSNPTYPIISSAHVNSSSQVGWNVAGVDFPVGVDMSHWPYCNGTYVSLDNPTKPCSVDLSGNSTGFIDPVTYDWANDDQPGYANVGCSQASKPPINNSTVSTGSTPYQITCNAGNLFTDQASGRSLITIQGFDWTPVKNGAYTCVAFELDNLGGTDGANGGIINFINNKINWSGAASCQQLNTSNGSARPLYLRVDHTQRWTMNVKYNSFNQNGLSAYHTTDNGSFLTLGPPITLGDSTTYGAVQNQLDTHIMYNYFNQIEGRTATPRLNCNGFDYSYNVVRNFGINSGGVHGEVYLTVVSTSQEYCPGTTAPYSDVTYINHINNTMWQDYGWAASLDAYLNFNASFATHRYFNIVSTDTAINTFVMNGPGFWHVTLGLGSYAFTGRSGFAFETNDILEMESPIFAGCPHNPTLFVYEQTGGVLASNGLKAAGLGNCPTNVGSFSMKGLSLHCLWCANAAPGTDTGLMLADQSPANNTLHWSKGVGNALQLPTSGGFGNFQSSHFRNNALYLAGGLFPGSGAGGSGQPIWMDFVGKGLSCLNPPSRPNGYPSPTSPYWRVSRNAIGASGNVYLDRGNNALYDANANFNTTMAPIRGFMVPGYGC